MSGELAQVLVLAGSVFMLLGGIGIIRMPDLFMRLSTVTKGGTLGLGLVLLGVIVEFASLGVLIKVAAVLGFSFITSPVAAHMVSRSAYFQGVSLWSGTVVDELQGQYEMRRHELASPPQEETMAGAVLAEAETKEQQGDD